MGPKLPQTCSIPLCERISWLSSWCVLYDDARRYRVTYVRWHQPISQCTDREAHGAKLSNHPF